MERTAMEWSSIMITWFIKLRRNQIVSLILIDYFLESKNGVFKKYNIFFIFTKRAASSINMVFENKIEFTVTNFGEGGKSSFKCMKFCLILFTFELTQSQLISRILIWIQAHSNPVGCIMYLLCLSAEHWGTSQVEPQRQQPLPKPIFGNPSSCLQRGRVSGPKGRPSFEQPAVPAALSDLSL